MKNHCQAYEESRQGTCGMAQSCDTGTRCRGQTYDSAREASVTVRGVVDACLCWKGKTRTGCLYCFENAQQKLLLNAAKLVIVGRQDISRYVEIERVLSHGRKTNPETFLARPSDRMRSRSKMH